MSPPPPIIIETSVDKQPRFKSNIFKLRLDLFTLEYNVNLNQLYYCLNSELNFIHSNK